MTLFSKGYYFRPKIQVVDKYNICVWQFLYKYCLLNKGFLYSCRLSALFVKMCMCRFAPSSWRRNRFSHSLLGGFSKRQNCIFRSPWSVDLSRLLYLEFGHYRIVVSQWPLAAFTLPASVSSSPCVRCVNSVSLIVN